SEGGEIYFREEAALTGKMSGEALFAYEDSAVIGLQRADGATLLNPPMDTPIAAGDQLIAISEDDDSIRLSGLSDLQIDESAIHTSPGKARVPERTLILGWNRHAPSIINGLDNYVGAGSETLVVASAMEAEQQIARECRGLQNQALTFQAEDTTSRRALDALDIPSFRHVIVRSYSAAL